MILDLIPFGGELDVLEIRLNELKDVVDYHVIAESSKTQTRKDKPYYYELNKERFSAFNDKIIYVKVESIKQGGSGDWSHEIHQRNSLVNGINELLDRGVQVASDDFFLLSDCDEIPRAEKIKEQVKKEVRLISFNHYFNSYFLDLYCPHRGWYGTVMGRLEYLETYPPEVFRKQKDNLLHVEDGGWHFSGLLTNGFDSLWNKYLSCIEPYDKEFLKEENKETIKSQFIQQVIKDKWFFYCDQPGRRDIKLEVLGKENLPIYVQNNLEKFKQILYHE